MEKLILFVIGHKKNKYIIKKKIYKYIQSGTFYNDYLAQYDYHDNDGINISDRNPYYNEMGCLYYVWKNLKMDFVGFCHYRRFFSKSKHFKKSVFFLNEKYILNTLEVYDIILPNIVNSPLPLYDYYKLSKNHINTDLDLLSEAIKNICPDYVETLNEVYDSTSLTAFNMLITRWDLFDRYCEFVFPILDYIYNIVKKEDRNIMQKRCIGYLSEILLNVWVIKNNLQVKYENVAFTEMNFFSKLKGKLELKAKLKK